MAQVSFMRRFFGALLFAVGITVFVVMGKLAQDRLQLPKLWLQDEVMPVPGTALMVRQEAHCASSTEGLRQIYYHEKHREEKFNAEDFIRRYGYVNTFKAGTKLKVIEIVAGSVGVEVIGSIGHCYMRTVDIE